MSVIVHCQQCGKDISVTLARKDRKRYCSKECQHIHKTTLKIETRHCSVCNTFFQSVDRGKQARKYCSKDCYRQAPKPDNRETRHCTICQKAFRVFPSRISQYCSKICKNKAQGLALKGTIRTSAIVQCSECGKPLKQYKSRKQDNQFCNRDCYAKWDSKYKSSPEWLNKRPNNTSQIEDSISNWLIENGIPHKRQHAIKHYLIDFIAKDVFIEVNGCYWHGCPKCFTEFDDRQLKRQLRDRQLATYCERRNIHLITIWEHDIRKDDYSVLLPLFQQ